MLALLTLSLIFNGMERYGLGLMLQDIKAQFRVSDTELGLLSGIGFALFYALMGVPIGRWADRGNRTTIITVTTLLWSFAVALCGAAGNFLQLLLVRVGVAVGEAGSLPTSFSLIADYFDRAERPRATAIYGGVGSAIATVVGFFGCGWLIQVYGWRETFWFMAAPGLVLAAAVWFTLKEPRAHRPPGSITTDIPPPSLADTCRTLWTNRSFRHLLMCLSVLMFFNFGIGQWTATYFIRNFGLTTGQVGTGFALACGIGGLTGAYLGGEMASRFAGQNERLQLRGMVPTIMLTGVFAAGVYFSPNAYWAFVFNGLVMMTLSAVNSPLFATLQALLPPNMRAVAFSLAYLVANLLGWGLGPLTTGALSDAFHAWAGEQSLRFALLALTPGYAWAAWHAWQASKTVTRDVAHAVCA